MGVENGNNNIDVTINKTSEINEVNEVQNPNLLHKIEPENLENFREVDYVAAVERVNDRSNVDAEFVHRGIFVNEEMMRDLIYEKSGLWAKILYNDLDQEELMLPNKALAEALKSVQIFQIIAEQYTGEYYEGNVDEIVYGLNQWLISKINVLSAEGGSWEDYLPSDKPQLTADDVKEISEEYTEFVGEFSKTVENEMLKLVNTGEIKDDWLKGTSQKIAELTESNIDSIDNFYAINK